MNVSFADCEEQAVWAQQVPLDLQALSLGEGSEHGLELTGVTGSVVGLDASTFNGEGAIVSLNSIGPGFVLSDVEGHVSGQGGIVGEGNEDIVLERIHLTGAPGIDVDRTSGSLLTSPFRRRFWNGVHFSPRSLLDSLVVERLNISGYSVGLSFIPTPAKSAPRSSSATLTSWSPVPWPPSISCSP